MIPSALPATWEQPVMPLAAGAKCNALTGKLLWCHQRVIPPGAGACSRAARDATMWQLRVTPPTAEAGLSATVARIGILEVAGDIPARPERRAECRLHAQQASVDASCAWRRNAYQ